MSILWDGGGFEDSQMNAVCNGFVMVCCYCKALFGCLGKFFRAGVREQRAVFPVCGLVLLGCGSTEILRMAAFAFLGGGKQLIQASPTFEAIEHYARSAGSEVISVRLTPAFAQ